MALRDNNFPLLDLMIAEGADPNTTDPDTHDPRLHEAAKGGFTSCARVLLMRGARPREVSVSDGSFPLMIGFESRSAEGLWRCGSLGGHPVLKAEGICHDR